MTTSVSISLKIEKRWLEATRYEARISEVIRYDLRRTESKRDEMMREDRTFFDRK
jgi:hypothetical protein